MYFIFLYIKYHCAKMVVFGGKTQNKPMNDLHIFNFNTFAWRQVQVMGGKVEIN